METKVESSDSPPTVEVFPGSHGISGTVIIVTMLAKLELRAVYIEGETWFAWFYEQRPLTDAAQAAIA